MLKRKIETMYFCSCVLSIQEQLQNGPKNNKEGKNQNDIKNVRKVNSYEKLYQQGSEPEFVPKYGCILDN